MRKFISISFLLLAFISQVGYYFFYSIERTAVRSEMQEEFEGRISQNALQVIVLEDNAIRWEEPGKEFYLNGILYDIASIEKQNGKTLMHCVPDKKELKIVRDAAKAVASTHDKAAGGKENKHSIKSQVNDYILDTHNGSAYSAIIPSPEYIDFDTAILSLSSAVDITPPRP